MTTNFGEEVLIFIEKTHLFQSILYGYDIVEGTVYALF